MRVPWRVLAFVDDRWPRLAHWLRFGTTNINTAAHWDEAWARHGRDGFRATDELELVRLRVLDEVPHGSAVLDVGCGAGELLERLRADRECECSGVDISAVAVEKLRAKRFDAQVSKLPRIPFATNRFDVVVCTETLEHVSDVTGTISEMARVLRADGKLVISVPDGRVDRESAHVHRFTPERLTAILDRLFHVRSVDVLSDGDAGTLLAVASRRSGTFQSPQ